MTGSLSHMTPQIPSTDPKAQPAVKPAEPAIVVEAVKEVKNEDQQSESSRTVGEPPASSGE